jgi:hypothetical protein
LSREVEFHGRKGARRAKPLLKEALKSVIPGWIYARLVTTHATFLCRERTQDLKKKSLAANVLESARL